MMRRKLSLAMLLLAGTVPLIGAEVPQAPQTARQALIEMLFGKTPGSFEKHLPEAMRAAIKKASTGSNSSILDTFALVTSQMHAGGQEMQTFEAGPILLSVEDHAQHTKYEAIVLRDDLQADEDDIELAFRGYKDGQLQTAGVSPRFTFGMKQEAGTWRLAEFTLALQISLTDPDFLKTMTSSLQTAAAGTGHIQAQPSVSAWSTGRSGNEASAVASLRTLLTAEASYRTMYPTLGFTCSLSDLGGMGSGNAPSEHQAMLVDPRLASGKKAGYSFALSVCNGTPVSRFRLTAVPTEAISGARAFCSDQSGSIRFSSDGSAASCLSAGAPLP